MGDEEGKAGAFYEDWGDWLRKSMDGNPNGSFKKVSSVEYQIPLPLDWGL